MERLTKDLDDVQDTSKVWKVEQSEGLLQKTFGELRSWGGSCVSPEELQTILLAKPNNCYARIIL